MNPHPIMSDLLADDLLLDRLGRRADVAGDPVVPLLSALARHADLPLRGACAPRRFARRRALTALTAFVVGASGVGVAAALSGPDRPWPRQVHRMDDPDGSPRVVPSTPGPVAHGVPKAQDTGAATSGYTLVEDATRRIGVAPPRVVVTLVAPTAAGEAPAFVAAAAGSEAPAGASSDPVRDPVGRPARAAGPGTDDPAAPSLATGDPKATGKPKPEAADESDSTPIMTLAGIASQLAPDDPGSSDDAAAQRGKPGPDDGEATSGDVSRQSAPDTASDHSATPPSTPAEPAGAHPSPPPARHDPRPERMRAPRPGELPVPVQRPVTVEVPAPAAHVPPAPPEADAAAAMTGATSPVPVVEAPPAG